MAEDIRIVSTYESGTHKHLGYVLRRFNADGYVSMKAFVLQYDKCLGSIEEAQTELDKYMAQAAAEEAEGLKKEEENNE